MFPNIKWIKEDDFRKQTLYEINNKDSEFTCFFTDDDIIYRKIDENEITSKLKEDLDCFCFSLRLGLNTKVCYTMNSDNMSVNPNFEDNKFISWDWTNHDFDFGYPLSVDGHIFRTKEIYKLSSKVNFNNPNTFEAALQIFRNFPKNIMWSYTQSALVNSPSNIVQSVFKNRKGVEEKFSTKSLNDYFLKDYFIKLEKMDFSEIVGCHQEINLIL